MNKKTTIITIIIALILALCINSYATDVNNEETQNNNEEIQNEEKTEENKTEETTTEHTEIPLAGQDETKQETEENQQTQTTTTDVNEQEITSSYVGETNLQTYGNSGINKSNNTNLRSIKVNVEGLTPDFDKNITDYYLVVNLETEKINIDAKAEDSKASVKITGNNNLKEGNNIVKITVTAEDGSTKIYKITVTKTDDLDFLNTNLKSLKIKDYDFFPDFKPSIYNYNLIIYKKITKLKITAKTEVEDATYEITGNENLHEGDNLIVITVTAKNGEVKKEYKINVFISSEKVKEQGVNTKQAYILIATLGMAIITVGIIVLCQRKK